MLNSVVLPAPFGPITAKMPPCFDLETETIDRNEAAEALANVLE